MRLKQIIAITLCFFFSISNSNAISIIRDIEAEKVIEALISPIIREAGISKHVINVYIFDSKDANAMVMGGQNIFISTSLISSYKNPDTLLGVIAHEMGHIRGGHIIWASQEMKNIEKQLAIGIITSIIAGIGAKSPEIGVAGVQSTQSYVQDSFYKFSQSQENSADLYAIKILKKIDINPTGLIEFLQNIKQDGAFDLGREQSYFSTHPTPQSRIDTLLKEVLQKESFKYPPLDLKEKYERVAMKFYAFGEDPYKVLEKFDKDNSTNGKYVKAIANYRLSKVRIALEYLEEIQTVEPKNPYFHELKGQILFEFGDYKKSVKSYEAALKAIPNSEILRYELASAMLSDDVNNSRKVILLLNKNVDENIADAASWKILAQAFQNIKEYANSYIATAYWAYFNDDVIVSKKYLKMLEHSKLSGQSKARYEQLKSIVASYQE